ncbi:hypothetical protein A6A04_20690 [Paramagnetospirillum marisnigri]|uniref:Uncharacterized protein n=1 Tax=Paramagnetospirillum marisnigri TaxID=1285242 RepID=A0A178MCG0_9PROT|nr:hypothetical protein [Paramagnetospirillum marisnigri]OAN46243.1 hypothetical protein A6A04_20690 [Paramagnetospirillum marisnigri]
MIVWSGNGYVLPLLVAVTVALGLVSGTALGLSDTHAVAVGYTLAAVATWIIGRRMNDPAKGYPMIDAKTGETVILRTRHTVFWVEVQWWAIPCALAAIGNGFRGALFPVSADPWPVVFVLVGLGLGGMVLGPFILRRLGAP